MGQVVVGKVHYDVNSFKLIDGVLHISDSVVLLRDSDNIQLQVCGSDLILAKLSSYTDVLAEGSIGKIYTRSTCCIFGRVLRYFSKENTRFYNGVAKSSYNELKKKMSRKVEGKKRVKVKCTGVFDNILIMGEDIEVHLSGIIHDIFTSKDVYVKGSVDSVVAEKAIYISK